MNFAYKIVKILVGSATLICCKLVDYAQYCRDFLQIAIEN